MESNKQDMLDKAGLTLPLKIGGKKLFKTCQEAGFSKYQVTHNLLNVTNTTGRTISFSDDYKVEIDKKLNVVINKVTPVK